MSIADKPTLSGSAQRKAVERRVLEAVEQAFVKRPRKEFEGIEFAVSSNGPIITLDARNDERDEAYRIHISLYRGGPR